MSDQELKKKVETLPAKPGVYLYKDASGEIIYVGKAIRLRSRVRSYFRNDPKATAKTKVLIKNIADIEYIVVSNEVEALILENNLIKEHRPKYNIRMRDDKNYLYLKVTNEDFPQVLLVRRMHKDGATYFGPYTSATAIRETLALVQKIFPYRKCEHDFFDQPGKSRNPRSIRPCIQHQIGRCLGICMPEINKAEHDAIISQVKRFFGGQARELVNELQDAMTQAAIDQKYELAARLRDQIQEIESLLAKQQAVMSDQQDRDVFGVAIEASKACVQLFKVRNGILIGREEFTMDCSAAVDAEEVLERTLVSYYEKAFEIPTEILIPQEMENAPVLSEWFGSLRAALAADRRLPQLVVPVRGEKKSLVDLVSTNAKQRLDELLGEWMTKEQRRNQALAELKDVLQLPRKPERIECFDISHLGGEGTVGAMAVFHAGEPRNSDYRRFKVQTIEGGDDYAALREVLTRRFERLQGMGIGLEGLTLRQPTDKAMKFIEERIMAERLDNSDLAPEQFLALRYKGEIVGFGRVKLYLPADDATGEHAVPIHELASLWIKPELRGKRLGYLLLSELIRKFKAKVFYGLTSEGHVPYYEGFGFKCIAAVPPVFSKKITHACASWGPVVCLRYDTTTKRKEDLSFKAMPDLVVIDGGKGQLSTAVEVMHELRLYHPEEVKLAGKKKKAPKTKSPKKQKVWGLFAFPIVGLAKEEEQLFVPWQSEPIPLAADSAGSLLVQALRDETHRFAITYQKKVRSKQMFK